MQSLKKTLTPTLKPPLRSRFQFLQDPFRPFDNTHSGFCRWISSLIQGLEQGNRASLAESITLIESSHPAKRKEAKNLMRAVLQNQKQWNDRTFRLGLSGPPGAGKSTFIECFGQYLTSQGMKIAVLAVDPSSTTSGGSILGDKTRMPKLSCDLNAYIRASPNRGHLGGVTRSTNEAIILCEAAGYDVVIVETVGVGQSEISVANMVDMFSLIIPPGGGDELQALKRGIMEMSDLIVVNKSDGDLLPAARRMQMEYTSALKFIRKKVSTWNPPVVRVSSIEGKGIDKLWQIMSDFQILMKQNGEFANRRKIQQKMWMWNHVHDNIMTLLLDDKKLKHLTKDLEEKVMNGSCSAGEAADLILESFFNVVNSPKL